MKYRFIMENRKDYPISVFCKVLGVSRAGYYYWQKDRTSRRRHDEQKYLLLIKKHYELSKGRYGLLRLYKAIRKEGTPVNKKRIYRIMKKYGIYSKTKRRFKVTTKQAQSAYFSENLLNGNFKATGSNQIWSSDITYLYTSEGWMYLAVILDIFNREIIGWALDQRATADLVVRALTKAVMKRKPSKGIIFHSDRGSQYTSHKLRNMLSHYGFLQSMSGKGNCYDNAITETFFSTVKKELIYLKEIKTKDEMSKAIFEFIEVYYNRQRLHSSLGYLSPVEFMEIKMKENQEVIKSEVA